MKFLLILIIFIIIHPVSAQHVINDNLVVETDGSTTIEVKNTSSTKYTKAGIAFKNTVSSSGSWYHWFAEKNDFTTGYSHLFLRKNTSDGYMNLLFFNDKTNDWLFNNNISSSAQTFGNFIFRYGKIGLGVVSPAAPLDIHNSGETGYMTQLSDVTSKSILKLRPHALNSTSFYFGQGDPGAGHIIQAANGHGTGAYNIILNPFGGNIGIGTLTPTSTLHVNGVVRSDNQFVLTGVGALQETSDNHLHLWSNKSIAFGASGSGNEMMRIGMDGNVGIGTTIADSKLTVKGTIHAEEVKVDLSVPGPDYVFEPDYKLISLDELAEYLKENKHLPEIPSAKEMEINGIELSKMNILLLKKIEELTLYVIDLEEKNKQQARDNAEILIRLSKLEELLK